MGAKKDYYLAVKAKLESIGLDPNDNTVKPKIKHVRLYNSQFDEIDSENTFPFPCVFVEFTALDWLTKSEGYQEAETTIRLHVGFESVKTEELDVLDLLEDIQAELQGFHDPEYFTPMDRNFEQQDTNHDNVIVWMQDYNTLLSDNAGNRNNKLVKTQIGDLCIDRVSDESTKPRLQEVREV